MICDVNQISGELIDLQYEACDPEYRQ